MRALFGGPEVLLDDKVIKEWNQDDVAYWVGEQGNWAKGVYDDRFRSAGIDGNLLLNMEEADLLGPPINMHLGLHRRVFTDALKKLKARIKDRPGNFWEFKVSFHPFFKYPFVFKMSFSSIAIYFDLSFNFFRQLTEQSRYSFCLDFVNFQEQ